MVHCSSAFRRGSLFNQDVMLLFLRIHSQTALKPGSQLTLKWFFFLFFPPTSRRPPPAVSGSSCGGDVIAQSPRRCQGTQPGSRHALATALAHIFCWRQAAFTPLRCIRLVWFARVLNMLCVCGRTSDYIEKVKAAVTGRGTEQFAHQAL